MTFDLLPLLHMLEEQAHLWGAEVSPILGLTAFKVQRDVAGSRSWSFSTLLESLLNSFFPYKTI